MNTERQDLILREVVETHIDSCGEAVGSKTIAARLRHRLSSASIRSVMSQLGQLGLLVKPHSSAGRVPTDLGYRTYLDRILVPRRLPRGDLNQVARVAWTDGSSADDVMRAAVATLSVTMGTVAMVFAPRLESAVLERVQLVWLGERRVIAVAVTRGGIVHERLLHVDVAVDRRDLERFSNYLNTLLPGLSLSEVRGVIAAELRRHTEAREALEEQALELGRRAFEEPPPTEVIVDGAARMLEQREFNEAPAKAVELLKTLEQRQQWLDLVDEMLAAEDTGVYVGSELRAPAFEPCAVVASQFRAGGGKGVLVLVGPKRLDYRRAIPFVASLAGQLTTVMTAADDGR